MMNLPKYGSWWIAIVIMMLALVLCAQEPVKPRVDLSYSRVNDELPIVKVKVRKRVDRRYYPVKGVQVEVFMDSLSDVALVGTGSTGESGEVVVQIPESQMVRLHSKNSVLFLARTEPTDSVLIGNADLEIQNARLTLLTNVDSTMTAKFMSFSDSMVSPVSEVEIKFFLKTSIGNLPISDEYLETDESGIVSFKFEGIFPGDTSGYVTIAAQVEDHDDFGTLWATRKVQWGTLTEYGPDSNGKSLSSSRNEAPVWLLILTNSMIAGIIGVIIYLLFLIHKIRKLNSSSKSKLS